MNLVTIDSISKAILFHKLLLLRCEESSRLYYGIINYYLEQLNKLHS